MADAAFNPFDRAVDYYLLSGQRSPGKLILPDSPDVEYRWQEHLGYGFSGGWVIFLGRKLIKFDMTHRLYTDQDWRDWNAFWPLIQVPPIGRRPTAHRFWHPVVNYFGIDKVMVWKPRAPKQVAEGSDIWEATITFTEWRAPKPQKGKPLKAKNKKKLSERDIELLELSQERDAVDGILDALPSTPQ